MTTTFNTMPPSALPRPRVRPSIIAALSLALIAVLAGCSFVKLGYGQASPLAFRWLDRYVDFDDAQSLRVRTALDETLAWHRRTQLPDYVDLLLRAEAEVAADTTPERMCAWSADLQRRAETVAQYLVPTIADLAVTLTPAQLDRIEKRQAESNDEFRDEHLQRNPQRRLRASVTREIERAEMLYGSLDDGQRELVARSVAASPYDGELAFDERQRRQQDWLALARRLRQSAAGRDDATAQVRSYVAGLFRSPREAYRGYSERLLAHNCALASMLHNATSAGQRRTAVQRLKGYETDLRALTADVAG